MLPATRSAADWPQYRADAERSGYTAEPLPAELHLQWTRVAPHPPEPAWPDVYWQRQRYDLAYQPVVARQMLFYGSSADCKVYALDAASGRLKWSYFTDAPVRFAPVVWHDRVFAVSDDGHLYCLAASDGSLLWKKRGGVDKSRILGNGRMMSRCPARGGPVIQDDVLYFGSGVFPTHGFFLHALDPETGETLWRNDTSGNLRQNHITGGYAFGNVTSQGYLAVSGNTLVVPTGRAVPAAFDRTTGAFRYFDPLELSYAGGSWLMAIDKMVFNSDMILDLDTGYTLSNKVGNPAEQVRIRDRPPDAERMIEAAASPTHIFVATGKRIKAIDRRHPLDETSNIWGQTQSLYFLWRGPRAQERSPHRAFATADLWSVPVDCGGTVIVAGERIFAGGKGVVTAVDVVSQSAVWSCPVEGTAYGLAGAEGRLYVSTDAGMIYCFGAERPAEATTWRTEPLRSPYADVADYEQAAREIIARSGVTKGYCLDVGCGLGELAYALAKQTDLEIIAVDEDAANVAAARTALDHAGLYGTRVTVLEIDPEDTRLPNYFANLVVSGRSTRHGESAVAGSDWRRSLRPYGGLAVFGKPGNLHVQRRDSLARAGSWTHQFADAANTSCSGDELLRGPLGVLWFGGCGPAGMPTEKSRSPAPLFVQGRLYVQGKNFLRCLDAYNGRRIWQKPMTPFPWARTYNGSEVVGSNYCVTADSVYISAFDRCRRLDGLTGEDLAQFRTPKLGQREDSRWMQVFVYEDLLLGTLESTPFEKGFARPGQRQIDRCMWVSGTTVSQEATHLFAMDRRTGDLKWSYAARFSIIPNSIAVAGGRVYLIDRPVVDPAAARRGNETAGAARLVALDARAGEVLWTSEDNITGSMLAVSEPFDVVLMGSDVKERGTLFSDYPQVLAAFRGEDGHKLWEKQVLSKQRPMIVGRTIIAEGFNLDNSDRNNALKRHYPSAWDLLTGETRMRSNPVSDEPEPWIYGRSTKCSYITSSRKLLFFRNAMTSYYDLVRDEGQSSVGGFRPSCFINVLPAGGIVLAPTTFGGCQCNVLLRTSLALEPVDLNERWAVFCANEPEDGVVRQLRLNLGALGDRRDDEGRLWFAFPRPPGYFAYHRSDTKTVKLDKVVGFRGLRPNFHFKYDMAAALQEEKGVSVCRVNTDTTRMLGEQTPPWVAASCCRGPIDLEIDTSGMPPDTAYRVRLHFAELEEVGPGERTFDVVVAGETVDEGLDVVREAGEPNTAVVKQFQTAAKAGTLSISLLPRTGAPILSGLEIAAQPSEAATTGSIRRGERL
jgi:outer membrane protein assembly factor BamB